MEVLNYSEYLVHDMQYGMNLLKSQRSVFFGTKGYCPFCKKRARDVLSKADSQIESWGPLHEGTLSVWECECGWWQIESYSYLKQETIYKDWYIKRIDAELRVFPITDKDILINILRKHLLKYKDDIHHINPKKMEELVQAIFRDFYHCEVECVGKSGDGGVDLILVNGDNPCLIQVKRRKMDSTEGVKEIRDLIGAAALNKARSM